MQGLARFSDDKANPSPKLELGCGQGLSLAIYQDNLKRQRRFYDTLFNFHLEFDIFKLNAKLYKLGQLLSLASKLSLGHPICVRILLPLFLLGTPFSCDRDNGDSTLASMVSNSFALILDLD